MTTRAGSRCANCARLWPESGRAEKIRSRSRFSNPTELPHGIWPLPLAFSNVPKRKALGGRSNLAARNRTRRSGVRSASQPFDQRRVQSFTHIVREGKGLSRVVDLDGFSRGIHDELTILTALQVNLDLS